MEETADFSITSEQAVKLTWQFQECLTHDIFFAQSLLSASASEIEALQRILKRANMLRGNKMDEGGKQIHRGIKLTDRALRRASDQAINPSQRFRRTFKVLHHQRRGLT